jgi:hypothetical protein
MVSQFVMQTEQKYNKTPEVNSWMAPTQQVFKSQFIDVSPKKSSPYNSRPFEGYQQS